MEQYEKTTGRNLNKRSNELLSSTTSPYYALPVLIEFKIKTLLPHLKFSVLLASHHRHNLSSPGAFGLQ